MSRELLAQARAAGGEPGDAPLTIDLNSTICETYGLAKEGARHHGYTGQRGYHPRRWHRRRADVPTAQRPGQHGPGRRSLPARDGGPGAPRRSHRTTHGAGRQRLLHPRHRRPLSQDGCPLLHHHPPAPSVRNIIEVIRQSEWTPIPYWMEGAADVAETAYTPFGSEPDAAPVRLIVRRVKPTPGSQLALFTNYSYHAFITDREGDTLALEADHRRHAEVENAIRDPASSAGQALKYGVGLNHLPSGRFPANGAWRAVQSLPRTRYGVIAHNLARWTARIGLGEQVVTTKTLRRRFFALPGRLTRSARRLTLHLPQRWPWETQFSRALARLRAIPLPA